MFLYEHMQAYLEYALFNIGMTCFYMLVVIGLLQVAKWSNAAILFALILSGGLLMACLYSAPSDIIGTGGGIALSQKAKDLLVVSLGSILGVFLSMGIKVMKKFLGKVPS